MDLTPQVDKPNVGDTVTISEYLVTRIDQLGGGGRQPIYGVPGDFNLQFLDFIENHPRLDWVGNCNELNAAYAADAYARTSKSLATLVTTSGVGELSAINGVAGSMAERLPILHIVGVASTAIMNSSKVLHHTLAATRSSYSAFANIAREITSAQAFLQSPEGAGQEIDRLILHAITNCKPVYLSLPTDLVSVKIPSAPLKKPLPNAHEIRGRIEADSTVFANENEKQKAYEAVADEITRLFRDAKNPIVVIDACALRYGVEKESQALIEAGNMVFFDTPMGKGAIDHSHPNFGGTYVGAVSNPIEVKELAEASDLVINLGALSSDFNTGGWSGTLGDKKVIELHSDFTVIGYARYPGVPMRVVLPKITEEFKKFAKPDPTKAEKFINAKKARHECSFGVLNKYKGNLDTPITHDWFWPRFANGFFQTKDVILTETGTSSFGILDVNLPDKVTSISQVLWGSIGYSLPAALGASIAARDQGRRTILFIGDGSLQLTLQELATMLRLDLKPIIVVLSNDGYEIERKIHGETAKYNDISHIDHQLLLQALSPPEGSKQKRVEHQSLQVKTKAELDRVLNDKDFASASKLTLLEVVMPRNDSPHGLLLQAEMSAKINA
ncbi:pyruvate decarboxylase [Wallemia mellicola]|nr:pyruvate decarboxylase [Wallemia mellicola]